MAEEAELIELKRPPEYYLGTTDNRGMPRERPERRHRRNAQRVICLPQG